jgi:parallel beta-helix repeat protein
MNTRTAFGLGMVLVVLVAFTAGVASAATYYVAKTGSNGNDGSSGSPWLTVQYGVTTSSVGDTIIVRDGFYNENVNVNKRLTIESENGSASTTVNASDSSKHVFNVAASYVNITGFRVTNATIGAGTAGIYLAPNKDHCNISSNNATKNYVGIRLNKSSYNDISFNTATDNEGGSGIGVGRQSNHNTVDNNTVTSNEKNGIGVGMRSHYNIIRDNDASNNEQYGIHINCSNHTDVTYNDISDNENYGMKVLNGYNNEIHHNDFISNSVPAGGTHQAWDNKANNWWDVDEVGNYWSDYVVGWPFTYSIDGDGQTDNNPSESRFTS